MEILANNIYFMYGLVHSLCPDWGGAEITNDDFEEDLLSKSF